MTKRKLEKPIGWALLADITALTVLLFVEGFSFAPFSWQAVGCIIVPFAIACYMLVAAAKGTYIDLEFLSLPALLLSLIAILAAVVIFLVRFVPLIIDGLKAL